MFGKRRAASADTAAGFSAALLLAALLLASAQAASAQEPEVPRRPQGPAAGPVIKLPRGAQADAGQPPQGEATPAQAAAPRRWEYCAITGFVWKQQGFSLSAPQKPSAVVRYFSGGSEEVDGPNEETALANAFARLGEEGWEMTGIRSSFRLDDGDGETSHVYFFKRPKPVE